MSPKKDSIMVAVGYNSTFHGFDAEVGEKGLGRNRDSFGDFYGKIIWI